MKKIGFILLIPLFTFFISSCDLFGIFGAKLYITDETRSEHELYTIKILSPGANSGSGTNIYANPVDTLEYDGYSWKVYNIPAGSSDIYMEFTTDVGFDSEDNERTEVYAEAGDWVAVWFIDSATDDTSYWEGSGDFHLDDCPRYEY